MPHQHRSLGAWLAVTLVLVTAVACGDDAPTTADDVGARVRLPPPRLAGDTSVEEALLNRRSVREYRAEPLELAELSQLLWAAQGTTDDRGLRTAPSAGALYPLGLYAVVGEVTDLAPGVYRYLTDRNQLVAVAAGDRRADLAGAAMDQEWVAEAAVDLVITAVPERTTSRYGERGVRYVHMEAGHAAQNVYLQAEALGVGVVVMGAFDDEEVSAVIGAPVDEEPLYVISAGRRP